MGVCGRSGREREGGRRSGPTEGLGLGSAVKQCRMGWGKAWNTNSLPYSSPGTTCREGGGQQGAPGENSAQSNAGYQWQVWRSFEFPLTCRTFGWLFSIKNEQDVLALSRTPLALRVLFCTAHWADLEGERNWVWKLRCSGALAVWQNSLTRWMDGSNALSLAVLLSSGIWKHFSGDHLEVTHGRS